MDRQSAAARIYDRSIFCLLPQAEAQSLCKEMDVFSYEAGTVIPRTKRPDELGIVVEGEVGLYKLGDRNKRQGVVTSGRSIELKAYLSDADSWRYDWVAESPTTLVRLKRAQLDPILEKDHILREYLKRVSLYPELQRLKNDLRLFGFKGDEIQRVLVQFRLNPSGFDLKSLEDGRHLVIVHQGDLTFQVEVEGHKKVAGQFLAGHYFVLSNETRALDIETSPDAQFWTIKEEKLKVAAPNKYAPFLELINPVADKARALQAAPPAETSASDSNDGAEEEDDGLTVADFKCDPKTLKKLHARKPFSVKQHDEMDCGAACMTMVANWNGRKINLPTFRSLVHVTRDGASMLALKKAAEKVGLQAMGVMSGYKGITSLRVPMIALMQYHFVVVYKATEKEVTIGDPGRGIVKISAEDFQKEWSKNALLLRTTPNFFKYPQSKSTFAKYLLVFQDSKFALLEILLASILIFILGLATPLFMQYVFDNVLANKSEGVLNGIAIGVILINLLSNGTDWVRSYLLTHMTSRLDAKFGALFMKHTFSLPLSFFAVRRVGDITTRLGEIEKIRDFFTGQTISMIISFCTAILYTSVLALYSLKLLAIVGAMLPILVLFVILVTPRMIANQQETYKALAKNQSTAFEQFNGLDTLKSLGATVAARWRWETNFLDGLTLRYKFERLGISLESVAGIMREAIQLAVLLTSVYLYMSKELTLGQVVAVSTLVGSVIGPVMSLVSHWNSFNSVGVSLGRVDDIFTSARENDPKGSEHKAYVAQGGIEFQNVTFQYGSEMSPVVLDGVSLKIEKGETVALVGRSGSGKTTIGYMVNLLYAPTKGRILLDGVDATEWPLEKLRSQIAMIIQDNSMFSGSILENITLGDTHPSFKKAMDAAKAADAHEFISKMQDGYSTRLSEGGGGLSGGQKQRINIARALYRDPQILIMDEATSALDALSEAAIVRNLKSRAGSRTTVIIAHRLNTILHADRIVVLDKGRVIENGTHKQLLDKQGAYYSMFRKQLNQ